MQQERKEQQAIAELIAKLQHFAERAKQAPVFEVLHALPGHGKTTALKQFMRTAHLHTSQPALIVLREKVLMREMVESLASNDVLYVDSDNYAEVRQQLGLYRYVVISHERLKNIALRDEVTHIQQWQGKTRLLFIDECPSFMTSATFSVDGSLDWLDACFYALNGEISTSEMVMLRSYVQIMFARELLLNQGTRTMALREHLHSDVYRDEMARFFQRVEARIDAFRSMEQLQAFRFFQRMYEQAAVGYISPALALGDFIEHKVIICSERVDYRKLGMSICILDGTAHMTPTIYNNEYTLVHVASRLNYARLHLHHREVNTSARQRQRMKKRRVQELIAQDIKNIEAQTGHCPFPLVHKADIALYKQLGVLDETSAPFFAPPDGQPALHLLNTTGKNDLREQHALYITSLPNRSPLYYRALAISLYKEAETPLQLSTRHMDKASPASWFADERIEQLYEEMLLSEVSQIIHRSAIRMLDETAPVHIYIATTAEKQLARLRTYFAGHTWTSTALTKDVLFEKEVEAAAVLIAQALEGTTKARRIGSLPAGKKLKPFLNASWKDATKRTIIEQCFARHQIAIYELPNKEKRVQRLFL